MGKTEAVLTPLGSWRHSLEVFSLSSHIYSDSEPRTFNSFKMIENLRDRESFIMLEVREGSGKLAEDKEKEVTRVVEELGAVVVVIDKYQWWCALMEHNVGIYIREFRVFRSLVDRQLTLDSRSSRARSRFLLLRSLAFQQDRLLPLFIPLRIQEQPLFLGRFGRGQLIVRFGTKRKKVIMIKTKSRRLSLLPRFLPSSYLQIHLSLLRPKLDLSLSFSHRFLLPNRTH